jgi:hypothetical protein
VASVTTDLLRDFSAKRTENGVAGPIINRDPAMLRRMFKLAERESKVSNVPYFPMQQEPNPNSRNSASKCEEPTARANLLLRDGAPHGCYGKGHLAMGEPLPSRNCACRPASSRTASP